MSIFDALAYLGQGAGQVAAGQMRGETNALDILARRKAAKELADLKRQQLKAEQDAVAQRAKAMEEERARRAAAPFLDVWTKNPDMLYQMQQQGALDNFIDASDAAFKRAGVPFDVTRFRSRPVTEFQARQTLGLPIETGAPRAGELQGPQFQPPPSPFGIGGLVGQQPLGQLDTPQVGTADLEDSVLPVLDAMRNPVRFQPSPKTALAQQMFDARSPLWAAQTNLAGVRAEDLQATRDPRIANLQAGTEAKRAGAGASRAKTKETLRLIEPRATLLGAQAGAAASTPGYRQGLLTLGQQRNTETARHNRASEGIQRDRVGLDARKVALQELQAPLTRRLTAARIEKLRDPAATTDFSAADRATWNFHLKKFASMKRTATGSEPQFPETERNESRRILGNLVAKYGGSLDTGAGGAPTAPIAPSRGPSLDAEGQKIKAFIDAGKFDQMMALPGMQDPVLRKRAKSHYAKITGKMWRGR